MGDESYGRDVLLGVGLERSVDVALLVHLNIIESLALKFLFEVLGENELLGSARHCSRLLARLRVELGIVQKSFCNVHLRCIVFLYGY